MVTSRGFTVLEVVISMAIASVVLGVSLTGGEAHRQTLRASFDRLDASLAASTYLESLDPELAPALGTQQLELGPKGLPAEVETTQVSEGLFDIRVRIRDGQGVVQSDLSTRIARKAAR